MPISELETLRVKYPQYNDIDDLTLATKISQKYPQYSDLLEKVRISQSEQKESLGRTLYRETISPIVSGSSTFAFGIPKAVAKKTGTKELIYPEQKTLPGKALRVGAEAVGFLGGGALRAGEKVGRLGLLAGKGLLKKTARGAVIGGVTGLLQTPEEGKGILKPKERLKQAETWGALGAAFPIAGATLSKTGEIITKSGRWVAKNIGGITDATVTTIKRLGANRVFDPLKAKADYITQNLAPKIYEKLTKFVDDADVAYKKAVNSFKGNSINSQSFYQSIQKGLREKGWIDLQGNPTTRYKSGIDPVVDKLTSVYLSMKPPTEGAKLVGQVISKEDFFTYRDALSSMLREKPSDRLVMQARNALYTSAENSGMAGIKVARDLEKKVYEMGDKIDVNKISRDLIKAKNPNWTKVIEKEYKELLGEKEAKPIFDDLMAHFANIDFKLVSETPGAGGGGYIGRSSILRNLTTEATKQYYQRMLPQTEKFKGFLRTTGERTKELIGR